MYAAKVLRQAPAQNLDLTAQLLVLEAVRSRLRAHNDVDRRPSTGDRHDVEDPKAAELSQAALESVALDRGVAVLRNDEADSGHRAGRRNDPHIETRGAEALAVPHHSTQVATASQPMPPP